MSLGFRFYGVSPDDLLRTASYRLQFAHAPSRAVRARIALAVRYVRGAGARTGDGAWRWAGRFAVVDWHTDGNYGLNVETCRAIHLAWPLREVVCLTATTASFHHWAASDERDTIAAQPEPDPGPRLSQSEYARYRVPQIAGEGFRRDDAFDRDLDTPLPRDARTRPWEHLLPVALAEGEVDERILHHVPPAAAPAPAVAPADEIRVLAGERAGLAWGPGDALAVVLDGEHLPIDGALAETAPIAEVAVDPSGTRALLVTATGAAVWDLGLDDPVLRATAWSPSDARFHSIAWIDDGLAVAACGRRVVALAPSRPSTEHDRHTTVVGGADLPATIDRLDVLDRRFVGVAAGNRYHLLAAFTTGLAELAAVACGRGGRGELDEDGRIEVRGRDRSVALDGIEPAWFRAARRDAQHTAGAGEVLYAPGEPVRGVDAAGCTWHTAGDRACVVLDPAGLVDRATGLPIEPGPRGALAIVGGSEAALVVHDGAALWSVGGDDPPPFAFPLFAAPLPDHAGTAYVGSGITLPVLVAASGVLALRSRDDGTLWSIPCEPIDLFATRLGCAAVRVRGGPLLLVALGGDGVRVVGRWPDDLPTPAAVWAHEQLSVRTADGRARWFVLPAVAYATGPALGTLTAATGRDAPPLALSSFAGRSTAAASACAAAIAAQDEADRPRPVAWSAHHRVLGLAPTDARLAAEARAPKNATVTVGDGALVAHHDYVNGALARVTVGADRRTVDVAAHGTLGAVAIDPVRREALLVCGDVYLVDLATGAIRVHLMTLGDRVTSAAYAGRDDVVLTTAEGFVALLRDTGDDLVELSRAKVFHSHAIIAVLDDGRTVVTHGRVDPPHELCALAIDGDRLVLVDTLRISAHTIRVGRAGDRILVDVPPAYRLAPGTFALTGLDRVAAPALALDRDRLALHRLAGGPPHPNRASMIAALPVGDPRPGASPDRWAIRTSAGLGFGLAREAAGAAYHAYAIAARRARPIEPVLAGTAMRYGLHAAGRRVLAQVEGERALHEVDLDAATARVVVDGMLGYGGAYAPGGVLLRGAGTVAFHPWDGARPVGAAAWSVECRDGVGIQTVHDHRVLFASDPDAKAVFAYAVTPRGLHAIGAAATTHLVTWEDAEILYFLDHYDQRSQQRFAITGLAAAIVAAAARAPVSAVGDPALLAELPFPRFDDAS